MPIQLATPFNISGPSITAENDPHAAATKFTVDMDAETLVIWFPLGTATVVSGKSTAFVPGLLASAPHSIQFSLVSNTWTASNGQQGTLTAAQISAVQTIMSGVATAIRNPAESFAQSVGVLNGTIVPW